MVARRYMPIIPDANMVTAAYSLLDTMPQGTPERNKRIVAAIWEAMAECAPQTKTTGLTAKQSIIHEIIAEFINEHGRAPELAEIAERTGRHKGDISRMLRSMRTRGAVDFKNHTKKSLRLLVQPGEPLKRVRADD